MKPCVSAEEWVDGRGQFVKADCNDCSNYRNKTTPICTNCLVHLSIKPYEKLIILLTKEGTEK